MLDAPIFQRVEADDGRAPAGFEHVGEQSEGRLKMGELVIDRDSQGLKYTSGRVDRPPLAGDAPPDDLGEPAGGFNRPRLDDSPGDAPAVPLFTVFKEDSRQLLFIESIDQIGRAGGARSRVEPHVERSVLSEAEAPVRPGKLVRRQADIEQDSIDSDDSEIVQHLPHLAIRRRHERHRQPSSGLGGQGEHGGVAVNRDHPASISQTLRQSPRMPPRARRAVDQNLALAGR